MTELEILKVYLQEEKYPMFSDVELSYFLSVNNNDPLLTASYLCLMKSNDNSKITIGPITIEKPGATYWTSLSQQYREQYEENATSSDSSTVSYYKTSKSRADEC